MTDLGEKEAMLPTYKDEEAPSPISSSADSVWTRRSPFIRNAILVFSGGAVLYLFYSLLAGGATAIALSNHARYAWRMACGGSSVNAEDIPDYFQTSPELWAGPTATGRAPFLAQTNPVFFPSSPSATFVPNEPLETGIPIVGNTQNQSIFQHMGYLSPYFPNPVGFGVNEYSLPPGANITQVQMLSRHGSRYPTSGSNVQRFGQRMAEANGKFKATGALAFLNDWKYELGENILVPRGREELFESGILHYYQYGQLYNPNSKIIARTTTQDRMLKSAEYFMAGFFGLEWTNNATLELIIEEDGFNNSLAGWSNCPNANNNRSSQGSVGSARWVDVYLQEATDRLKPLIKGYDWTVRDTYAAQNLCPYETIAYGYSAFCPLFTYEEWIHFGYSVDLSFLGGSSFLCPTGRAMGLGYVQETIARLENHTLGYSGSQINVTLDNNTDTFPLNQTLYFDFSHDTNIMSILTAFGFRQFSEPLSYRKYPGDHPLRISHMEPFAARLDIEIIKTPSPLGPDRKYQSGKETTYVHFILNQRTLPLGKNFPECDADRLDGWCELDKFIKAAKEEVKKVDFEYACFGDYEAPEWGDVTDGRPPPRKADE